MSWETFEKKVKNKSAINDNYLWSRRWSCLRKALWQISHLYGLSLVCVLSWIKRLYDLVNFLWQYLQINSFFGRWKIREGLRFVLIKPKGIIEVKFNGSFEEDGTKSKFDELSDNEQGDREPWLL